MPDPSPTNLELPGKIATSQVRVYQCQKRWGDLEASGHADVRYCDSCKQTVHRVVDVEGFQRAVAQSRCVMVQGRDADDGTPAYIVGKVTMKVYQVDAPRLPWEV